MPEATTERVRDSRLIAYSGQIDPDTHTATLVMSINNNVSATVVLSLDNNNGAEGDLHFLVENFMTIFDDGFATLAEKVTGRSA